MSQPAGKHTTLKRAYLALECARAKLAEYERRDHEPIAIIGIGCRFPGGADNVDAFWRNLRDGVDGISEIPPDRWDVDALYDPDPAAPGKMTTRWGGFLEDVDRFDHDFFGISSVEAAYMDPQHRVMLEVAWEALEDSGLPTDALAGSRTGVFLGIVNGDYAFLQYQNSTELNPYATIGSSRSFLSGRISYLLDLKGPSIVYDTACSSSLVGVHDACRSLRRGETDLAIAGGVNLILAPEVMIAGSKVGLLAPDGRCKAFDANADGIVRSDGCGAIVLKRLSDAMRDGDLVIATIRGSAVNQDGRGVGPTAPNLLSQKRVIRQALADAGVQPHEVGYIEAHGTGTPLGDPIEIEALADSVGIPRQGAEPCVIGSVKTNIGHPEAAAGIAGLIKTALALEHEEIPAHLHLQQLNPHIDLDETRLAVARDAVAWPRCETPRVAGVSSFGMSGTNVHIVLAEAPEPAVPAAVEASNDPIPQKRPHLLPLSARSPEALRALAGRYLERVTHPETPLSDLCASAATRRAHHTYRVGVVAGDREELLDKLRSFTEGQHQPGICSGEHDGGHRKLAFVFSGQGSQWLGMGQRLREAEPVFRETLDACDARFQQLAGKSLLTELECDEKESRLGDTEIAQPLIFAIQVSLAALLRSLGIEPDACVGHSLGEVAAAYVAGALSFEDATRIIVARGRLMQRTAGQGRMATVELSAREAERELEGDDGRVVVAAENSVKSTVLSGDSDAIAELVGRLSEKDVFCGWLRVDHAFHSPQMEPLRDELVHELAEIAPRPAAIPLFSTVTGERVLGTELGPDYWCQNLCDRVRFAPAIAALCEEGFDVFLEIGAHPVLQGPLREELENLGQPGAVVLSSLRRHRDEPAELCNTLGELYACGREIEWSRVLPQAAAPVRLPSYPWQRQRCWYDDPDAGGALPQDTRAAGALGVPSGHPWLGDHLRLGGDSTIHGWQSEVSVESLQQAGVLRLSGNNVLAPAVLLEIALAAGRHIHPSESFVVRGLRWDTLPPLPDQGSVKLQIVATPEIGTTHHLRILMVESDQRSEWTDVAQARLAPAVGETPALPCLDELRERCAQEVAVIDPPGWRGISWTSRECVPGNALLGEHAALLELGAPADANASEYLLPPAASAEGTQLFRCTPWIDPGGQGWCVSEFEEVVWHLRSERDALPDDSALESTIALRAHADAADALRQFDLFFVDAEGSPAVSIRGLQVARVEKPATGPSDWSYTLRWDPVAAPEPDGHASGCWLIFEDGTGTGSELRAQLEARGAHCIRVRHGEVTADPETWDPHTPFVLDPADPEGATRLLAALAPSERTSLAGVVHLWSLDTPTGLALNAEALEAAQDLVCTSVLHLVQALVAHDVAELRLALVTRGAQPVDRVDGVDGVDELLSVAASPLWGLGKAIAYEHPELNCVRIDLDPAEEPDEAARLTDEICAADAEDQIARREGRRLAQRLVRYDFAETTRSHRERQYAAQPGARYRIEIGEHPIARDCEAAPLGVDSIEIQVRAVGLLPWDHDPKASFHGWQCAGVISRVGTSVSSWQVGDRVMAIAPGCFSSHAIARADHVMRVPSGLDFAEAATLPFTYAASWHALVGLARLAPGERLRVRADAGFEHAALAIARRRGAELVGEREDADVLLDGRSDGSLTAELEAMAAFGRCVTIARDVSTGDQLPLASLSRNLAFFHSDLTQAIEACPERVSTAVTALRVWNEEAPLTAPTPETFAFERAAEALGACDSGAPVALLLPDPGAPEAVSHPFHIAGRHPSVRPDATYLVTGGLRGVGLCVARWLVRCGARHLVLVGRDAAPEEAAPVLAELRAQHVEVRSVSCDVTQGPAVSGLLEEIRRDLPPLRGIVHAAAVLEDGLLASLDRDRFLRVLAPKLLGAWNLHVASADDPLEFFTLFSSIASLIGSPGQSNYTAANAFLDAFAHARRAQGRPAQTINWGSWGVGTSAHLVAAEEKISVSGMHNIGAEGCTRALDAILAGEAPAQLGVISVTWPDFFRFLPATAELPLLRELAAAERADEPNDEAAGRLRAELAGLPSAERRARLEAELRSALSQVLSRDLANFDATTPLTDLDFDSLMALELKSRLESLLGVGVSAAIVFSHPTLERLVPKLEAMIGAASDDEARKEAA